MEFVSFDTKTTQNKPQAEWDLLTLGKFICSVNSDERKGKQEDAAIFVKAKKKKRAWHQYNSDVYDSMTTIL